MKTEFQVINTSKMKVVKCNKAFIELFDTHLKWFADYKCNTKNDDTNLDEEEDIFNNITVDKQSISEILLYRMTSTGNFCVEVGYGTGNRSVMVHYTKEDYGKAKTLYEEIIKWRYSNPLQKVNP